MPQYYTVVQGDYLAKIAARFGFSDGKIIWNHPDNSDLRKRRSNPNVLFPGDRLFIPDPTPKTFFVSTEARHPFVRKGAPLRLVLILENLYADPRANLECELLLDGRSVPKTTDDKGRLEERIGPDAEEGYLIAQVPESAPQRVIVPLRIGHLDPVETRTGQAARLDNLGYFAGPREGAGAEENERRFRSAVEEFQCDHGLQVDGVCGEKTQTKLREVHGC